MFAQADCPSVSRHYGSCLLDFVLVGQHLIKPDDFPNSGVVNPLTFFRSWESHCFCFWLFAFCFVFGYSCVVIECLEHQW